MYLLEENVPYEGSFPMSVSASLEALQESVETLGWHEQARGDAKRRRWCADAVAGQYQEYYSITEIHEVKRPLPQYVNDFIEWRIATTGTAIYSHEGSWNEYVKAAKEPKP